MTNQMKRTIDAADIRAIEIECRNCGVSTSWPIAAWNSSFTRCPSCGQQWPVTHHFAYQAMPTLVQAIQQIAKLKEEENFQFSVRLELVESKDKQ